MSILSAHASLPPIHDLTDLTSTQPVVSVKHLPCLLGCIKCQMSNKIGSVKAKLVSKLSTNTEDKARLKHACSTAISGLEITLKIAKEATGHAGVPGLQTGISGLLFVISVIKVDRYRISSMQILMIQ